MIFSQQVLRRWPVALRSAFSLGAAAAVGWAVADLSTSLLATLGAFTALYAGDRPYANRARVLAGVAVSITIVITLGLALRPLGWESAAIIVIVAAVVTFMANATRIGPPGAYMIILAGAAGTSLPQAVTAGHAVLLVSLGGAVAWVVHMAEGLIDPRGPERRAVLAACGAVAQVAATTSESDAIAARRRAAQALNDAWAALMTFQPRGIARDETVAGLRVITRELHAIFAARIVARDRPAPAAIRDRIRVLAQEVRSARRPLEPGKHTRLPLGRSSVWTGLRESLAPGSIAMRAAIQVALGGALAASLALFFDFTRPYWAIAAAVVVLHQGLNWSGTWRRALERILGTGLGLVLAAIILVGAPHGVAIVAGLMVLQFIADMLIVRHYAIATVFVTASALMIAVGGHADMLNHRDVLALLWSRGADTVLGCAAGIIVYALTGWRSADRSLAPAADAVERAAAPVASFIATGDVVSPDARRARHALQHRLLALASAHDHASGDAPSRAKGDEALIVRVCAVEQQGYAILAACWSLESDAAAPVT